MSPVGIINLDKPGGLTSARAVGIVKRLIPRGIKIGHAGTLDPFATGVLLLLVGKATRSCELLMDQPKQYEATIRLGATTVTDDLDSPAVPWPGPGAASIPTLAAVATLLPSFVGEILQRPPVFSALKVGGRRAYDLARRGEMVALQPRRVAVYKIELIDYRWPDLQLRIDSGRGTYIRSIARDIGQELDCGGYLTKLRRTRSGGFDVSQAVTLETLKAEGVDKHLHPVPGQWDA